MLERLRFAYLVPARDGARRSRATLGDRVMHHFCPTCEQSYSCPRGETDCGSPQIYDCYCCYVRRHKMELSALIASVTMRFGDDPSCTAYGDCCFAH